ncbi:hypothetical protein BT96DRAFT_990167 [Gymnopus androsaceus JB14]|uniref:Uncharacterized protein n=1 Tax=Gymnopus androsaceus JB14 TaxID=1447944 RepID=A0A6A4I2U9_9AGAR|nr:hypothetical protein BT96DRAFT_990167 [Gymnopus androsaceus JB14]
MTMHIEISLQEHLNYLAKEGYTIGLTKLKKLNQQYAVQTVCKPPPLPVATTAISTAVAGDIGGRNGPSTIQQTIDTVQKVMKANFPHGTESRFPGKHTKRLRGHLVIGSGVFQEVHCDGHEKLNSKALCLGSVNIDMYGMQCHSSGKVLHDIFVPNTRCSSTIGHIYLDFVTEYGMICEQLTVDGGSETGEMFACHTALTQKYQPRNKTAAFFALPSTKNVVIEGSWNHWLRFHGTTLYQVIELGRSQGYFAVGNQLHINLFHWIWPKIVQAGVNEFIEYWNNHKTRIQKKSNLPSGVAPNIIFDFPATYGLRNCGTPVDLQDIEALRQTIPRSRAECFHWVSDEFDTAAQGAYSQLGSLELTHTNGWQIFVDMAALLGQ